MYQKLLNCDKHNNVSNLTF